MKTSAQTHETFIRRSVAVAAAARRHGNHPFGSLLVKEGKVILTAENTVVTEPDATGHAETNLVRWASKKFKPKTLAQCTLYTSTEPCAMCAAAIFWAGIPKLVYGVSAERFGREFGWDDFCFPSREIFARAKTRPVEVIGPVLEDECLKPHIGFWDQTKP
jgi:tRNA(Arg) A34 adenosine deaminase TadA